MKLSVLSVILCSIFIVGISSGSNISGIKELEKDLSLVQNGTQLYFYLNEYLQLCKQVKDAIEKSTDTEDLTNLSLKNLTVLFYNIQFYVSYLDKNTSSKIKLDCVKAIDDVLNTTRSRITHYTKKIEQLKSENTNLTNKYNLLKDRKTKLETLRSEYSSLSTEFASEYRDFQIKSFIYFIPSLIVGSLVGWIYHQKVVRKLEIISLFSKSRASLHERIVLLSFAVAFILSLIIVVFILIS